MSPFGFTPEEDQMLIDFINGKNNAILFTSIPNKVAALNEQLMRALAKESARLLKQTQKIQSRLDNQFEIKEKEYINGNFTCLEFPTEILFQAICYKLDMVHQEYGLRFDDRDTKNKAMMLLFSLYSLWLYKHKERICLDHPQAIEQGPWFWVAIKKSPLKCKQYEESYKKVSNTSAEMAGIIKTLCEKHSHEKASETCKNYKSWKSYKECHKDYNSGKWNKTLSDGQIYLDRKALTERQKNI